MRIFSAHRKLSVLERYLSLWSERFHCLLLEKKAAHKIHMKPHPGLRERIFHILTSEDIDYLTDVMIDP